MPKPPEHDEFNPSGDVFSWPNTFALLLRQARLLGGLSLRDLEKATGISHSEIHKIESGRQDCRLSSFVEICVALGIPAGHVLDDSFSVSFSRFQAGVEADPQFVKMFNDLGLAGVCKHSFFSIHIASVCAFAAYMVRCSFAGRVAKRTIYPSEDVSSAFTAFAHRLDELAAQLERAGIAKSLDTTPVFELQNQLLLPDSFLAGIASAIKANAKKSAPSPYRIVPRGHGVNVWSPWIPLAGKSSLINVSESVKHGSVKPHLPNLLDRLREATKERGKKSALAEYLGVPLASVSQWLSGEREPGGETTLRLLKWVEAAERK